MFFAKNVCLREMCTRGNMYSRKCVLGGNVHTCGNCPSLLSCTFRFLTKNKFLFNENCLFTNSWNA